MMESFSFSTILSFGNGELRRMMGKRKFLDQFTIREYMTKKNPEDWMADLESMNITADDMFTELEYFFNMVFKLCIEEGLREEH